MGGYKTLQRLKVYTIANIDITLVYDKLQH